MWAIGILWIILVLLAVYCIYLYNTLVSLKVNRENAFADIDVQLKQRFDLVPNLVETVKGYATHEKELLRDLTQARSARTQAQTTNDKVAADSKLTGALTWLFAVAENYPDLKANTNFVELQRELADIENKIAAARRFFNNATKEFNTRIHTFPSTMIAQMAGYTEEEYFELTDREKEGTVPGVKF